MILDSKYIDQVNAKVRSVSFVECPACHGSGKDGIRKCATCGGEREVRAPNWVSNYRFKFDKPLKQVPLLELARALDEAQGGNFTAEKRELILKIMIVGIPVTAFYKEKELGAFILNDVNASFDGFEVLASNPSAYRALTDLAVASIMEKSLPPQTNDPAPAAKPAKGPSESSVGSGS